MKHTLFHQAPDPLSFPVIILFIFLQQTLSLLISFLLFIQLPHTFPSSPVSISRSVCVCVYWFYWLKQKNSRPMCRFWLMDNFAVFSISTRGWHTTFGDNIWRCIIQSLTDSLNIYLRNQTKVFFPSYHTVASVQFHSSLTHYLNV